MNQQRLERLLFRSFLRGLQAGRLSVERFVESWFETLGGAYYFLFSKNLTVTNIQFAELVALLRVHTRDTRTGQPTSRILFLSFEELEEGLEDLVDSFSSTPEGTGRLARTLTELYLPLISRMAVLEPMFGSCAVFLPPHLEPDLASICGYSGYVHSCGHLVYLCRSDRSTPEGILEGIRAHLERDDKRSRGQKLRFVLYGKEEFGGIKRKRGHDLRHGLEDVQVVIDKFYIGDMRLLDFPRFLETQLPRDIKYVNSWEKGRANRALCSRNDIDKKSTLFLLVEKNLGVDPQRAGEHRLYVCYQQLFVNENPFQAFEENKPAWWSPTTMPHSLAGAMINLSRPLWPAGKVRLAEPFAGSGTTALESLKFAELTCEASDLEWITPLLARDNLTFLAYSSASLSRVASELRKACETMGSLQAPRALRGASALPSYEEARALLDEAISDQETFEVRFEESFVERLGRRPILTRLWFYIALRAVLRHAPAFQRRAVVWEKAYRDEAETLLWQIERLIEIRRREENGDQPLGRLKVYSGEYSQAVSVASSALRDLRGDPASDDLVYRLDATHLAQDRFDVVVTDPPYGFNTEEDLLALAELYRKVVESIILSLRDGGQFIVCLPERSYTGRRTRSFARARFFTEEVEACAEEKDREVLAVSQGGLEGWDLLRPPYYWEAEQTLRRSILHFRVWRKGDLAGFDLDESSAAVPSAESAPEE